VIAEHDGKALTAGTLSTINAASKLGGEVWRVFVKKEESFKKKVYKF